MSASRDQLRGFMMESTQATRSQSCRRVRLLPVLLLALVFAFLMPLEREGRLPAVQAAEVFEPHDARLDGMRVRYQNSGSGQEALIFVHGWACDQTFWRLQTPAFLGKVRIILVDLPGHGESDKPDLAYTQQLFVGALHAVMRDAGVTRAALVGHSLGTMVIRQFYRQYPDQVRALVFVDGNLRPHPGGNARSGPSPYSGPNYREAAIKFIDGLSGPETPSDLRAEIRTSILKTPQHVMIGAAESLAVDEIWTPDRIDVPVLGVYKVLRWPADNEQFLRGFIPNLEYVSVDKVGHFVMLEKPKEFNEVLERFLVKNGLMQR
jgi:pimeloyl-ACP methyl ester carboxylesterase